jgi:hypothetical protein
MPERTGLHSELVEIARRNGDFRKNYGTLVGAYLYLRTINSARGRSLLWPGLIAVALSAVLTWLEKHSWLSQLIP